MSGTILEEKMDFLAALVVLSIGGDENRYSL